MDTEMLIWLLWILLKFRLSLGASCIKCIGNATKHNSHGRLNTVTFHIGFALVISRFVMLCFRAEWEQSILLMTSKAN